MTNAKIVIIVGIMLGALCSYFVVALLSNRSYRTFEQGVCRANLIAYTQNHIDDNDVKDILQKVRADLARDKISVCNSQDYRIEYAESRHEVVIGIGSERVTLSTVKLK